MNRYFAFSVKQHKTLGDNWVGDRALGIPVIPSNGQNNRIFKVHREF